MSDQLFDKLGLNYLIQKQSEKNKKCRGVYVVFMSHKPNSIKKLYKVLEFFFLLSFGMALW